MRFGRRLRYYYLLLKRLRGDPHDLALGMAVGAFSGMLPVMPFQSALAVTLAIPLKASKITALIGTWVSNPLNWYFLYYYSFKLGANLLGLPDRSAVFASIMKSIRSGDEFLVITGKLLGAGGTTMGAFLVGGFIMGFGVAPVVYYVFLYFFRYVRRLRKGGEDTGTGNREES